MTFTGANPFTVNGSVYSIIASGTYTFTPSVTRNVNIIIYGPGGGGTDGNPGDEYSGGGGGGGGSQRISNYALNSGTVYTVAIQAGGARGVSGGVSTLSANGNTILSAKGGFASLTATPMVGGAGGGAGTGGTFVAGNTGGSGGQNTMAYTAGTGGTPGSVGSFISTGIPATVGLGGSGGTARATAAKSGNPGVLFFELLP